MNFPVVAELLREDAGTGAGQSVSTAHGRDLTLGTINVWSRTPHCYGAKSCALWDIAKPVLYSLDASNTHLSSLNQKGLRTLSNVPWEAKSPQLITTTQHP